MFVYTWEIELKKSSSDLTNQMQTKVFFVQR